MARRRMAIPHPSITGMASGLAIATYLNKGTTGSGGQRPGVLGQLQSAKYGNAVTQMATNAMQLVNTDGGRKALTGAIAIAAAGGIVRKWFPSIKLGGQKLFFRI